MNSSKLLLFVADQDLRREALQAIRTSDNQLPLEQHDSDWASLLERVSAVKPEVLVLDVSAVPGQLTNAFRQVRCYAPQSKIVALHSIADPQTILAAMRAGANEFLHPPLECLPVTLARMMQAAASPEDSRPRDGKIIGFLSAKGGCGATTLACHVAYELQNVTAKKVLLTDLDLTSGLVSFLMKTPSSYSILDAVKNLSRLDESLWKALTLEHKPNLTVMPAPASCSRWDYPDQYQLRQVLKFTRSQHDWIVLDLGRGLDSIAMELLDEIDQLFVVSTLEVVALHRLKSIVHGLFSQGEKLQLILNRTPQTMDISTQELEKILSRSLYATLPNDYLALYQSYSSGNLLDSSNRLAQHFSQLASKIAGLPPVKPKKKFALFG